jgi:signal transduction histidine kinase
MHQEYKETYIIILIIALGVLFIFILFSYLIYNQFQKNRKLFLEKLNAEYIGRAEERRRISKDLHDEFGALLSSTKIYLSTLQNENFEIANLNKTIKSVSEGLDSLHKITNDIYPSALNKNNLKNGIKDLIYENSERSGLKIFSNIDEINIDKLTDKTKKVQLYWILKEIIINTIKHSSSNTLEIMFMQTKNEIIIKTKDEGTGILINLELTKRNGITNITNRVEILNGIIEIISPKGKGLEYLIKIPISDEK